MRTKGLILASIFAAMSGAVQTSSPQEVAAQTSSPQSATQTSSGQVEARVVQGKGRTIAVANTPTPADMYCAGFITTDHVPTSHYVAAGWNSPDQTRYGAPVDYIYIRGRDVKVGDRFQIVRPVRDMNYYQFYPGQRGAIHDAGEPYFEMGYAKVIDVQKHTAVAVPELACGDYVVGDLAIPWVERPAPVFRVVTLDRFAPPNGKRVGRIIMANQFDSLLGTRYIAYINLGEKQGIKVGDYLRATRTYNYIYHDHDMGMSRYASAMEDTQKNPQKLAMGDLSTLPRMTLGSMIVLQVHRRSSTVLITSALQDIHVGDGVELMDVSAAPEVKPIAPGPATPAPPKPEAEAEANPPQISCTAMPASVIVGGTSTITCQASSRDNRPLSITFVTNGGKLSSSRNQATLDTTDTGPGPISVRATVYDDRQLSSAATTTINVEAPPAAPVAPTPQKVSQLEFKVNSAYVNNRSKAILDDLALKLQQDPTSTAVLYGAADAGESPRLSTQRAENAKIYLTKSKGIDPQRIQTKPGTTPGRTVDLWTVPPGATAPQ